MTVPDNNTTSKFKPVDVTPHRKVQGRLVVHDWFGGRHSRSFGNVNDVRKSKEYRIWRHKVKERDAFTCRDCGAYDVPVEAHHIKSFSRYPELRFETSNGVTLCKPCHDTRHGKGGK